MKKDIVKVSTIHLAIMLAYIGLTSYEFVNVKEPNPIGVGIQQWLLIILQFLITVIIGLLSISYSKNKSIAKRKMKIGLLSIIAFVVIYICFSELISKWLWSLRKGVIQ